MFALQTLLVALRASGSWKKSLRRYLTYILDVGCCRAGNYVYTAVLSTTFLIFIARYRSCASISLVSENIFWKSVFHESIHYCSGSFNRKIKLTNRLSNISGVALNKNCVAVIFGDNLFKAFCNFLDTLAFFWQKLRRIRLEFQIIYSNLNAGRIINNFDILYLVFKKVLAECVALC